MERSPGERRCVKPPSRQLPFSYGHDGSGNGGGGETEAGQEAEARDYWGAGDWEVLFFCLCTSYLRGLRRPAGRRASAAGCGGPVSQAQAGEPHGLSVELLRAVGSQGPALLALWLVCHLLFSPPFLPARSARAPEHVVQRDFEFVDGCPHNRWLQSACPALPCMLLLSCCLAAALPPLT